MTDTYLSLDRHDDTGERETFSENSVITISPTDVMNTSTPGIVTASNATAIYDFYQVSIVVLWYY